MSKGQIRKKKKTAILTPLQVKEALITWARSNGLLEMEEDVEYKDVLIRGNGSASIHRFKEEDGP